MFIEEVRIIKLEFEIKSKMKYKITFFLTLLVDFSAKIALFLKKRNDRLNSLKIYRKCYFSVIEPIINSSTSVITLLILEYKAFTKGGSVFDRLCNILLLNGRL